MLDTLPELRPDALVAATATLPAAQPVVMLNLLRYRDQAVYDDPAAQPPQTGEQAFQAYVAAFRQYNDPAGFSKGPDLLAGRNHTKPRVLNTKSGGVLPCNWQG